MNRIFAGLCLLLLWGAACAPAPSPTAAPTATVVKTREAPPTAESTEAVAQPSSTAVAETSVAATEIVADETTPAVTEVVAEATAVLGAVTAQPTTSTAAPLRVAVLPVMNALPMYVAEMEGFYQDEGVAVDLVTYGSAREREQAMQDGAIDAESTDIVAVVLLNNAGFDLRAVRWDSTSTPFFSIVVAADSDVTTVNDLKNVEIAISENTVIEYMTRVLLREAGFSEDEIRLVNLASIPRRLEALLNGDIAAATLPEPTTAQALAGGARVVVNDAETTVVPTVLAFTSAALADRPDDVRAFLRAYERAVEAINADPASYRDLFIPSASLPAELRDTYEVPQFRTAGVASESEINDLLDWMDSRGVLRQRLPYANYVDGSYLP